MVEVLRAGVKLSRFILCVPFTLLHKCKNTPLQMSLKSLLQNSTALLSRYRKVVFIVIAVLVILLYLQPTIFNIWGSRSLKISKLDSCAEEKLSLLRYGNVFDHTVTHNDLTADSKDYIAYVGNGKVAVQVSQTGKLLLRNGRLLSLPINYIPVITPNMEGHHSKGAGVINVKTGIVHSFYCFKIQNDNCIIVDRKVYAHRARPSLLVQEFKLYNPLKVPVNIDLEHIAVSGWKGSKSQNFQAKSKTSAIVDSSLTTGVVSVPDTKKYLLVTIATQKVTSTVKLKADSTERYNVITAIEYTEVVSEKAGQKIAEKQQTSVKQIFSDALEVDIKILRQEHTDVWAQIWYSGFGISLSKAPGVLNGDRINTTIYYVLSNVPSPIHELGVEDKHKRELEKLLYYPDRCYDQHNTLQIQGSALWSSTGSEADVSKVVNSWLVTLNKSGCDTMIQAGADGVIQAMVLSFGGFVFKNQHLEFRTHPSDLHRNYYFRRINYGNNAHLNVSVIVGEDNRAYLYISLDRNDKPYYACDAGCLDPPVKLSKKMTKFPVKVTKPLTAILYITYDKQHMDELKHSIHVEDNREAPAHEQHVIALHKHGHHLGGLPLIFWISIIILVIIFHLFLLKLVFNEYCQVNFTGRTGRGKFNF